MKKLLLVFAATLLLFAVGCRPAEIKKTEIDDNSSIVIVPSSATLEIDGDTTLEDYITALKDAGKLTFEGTKGDFGLFLTSMDGRENKVISSSANSSEGYSWTLYIDFLTLDGVIYAGDSEVCDYRGTTLYKASYGVSAIPCLEGHTYAFVYEYYNFIW